MLVVFKILSYLMYEAMRILFVRKENKNNNFIQEINTVIQQRGAAERTQKSSQVKSS